MSWIGNFRKPSKKKQPISDHFFGRFSDAYKSQDRYGAWEESLQLFDEKRTFESYRSFFKYLTNDNEENVFFSKEGQKLLFSVIQGSNRIKGFITPKEVFAESKIVTGEEYPFDMLFGILNQNYDLKVCRFAMFEDSAIRLIFRSSTIRTSPYKLYYALKEMALTADKADDLLLGDYAVRSTNYEELTRSHSATIRAFFLRFFKEFISHGIDIVEAGNIDKEEYPGAIRYLIFATIYKIDFLIRPDGVIMEDFERMEQMAFAEPLLDSKQLNASLIQILRELTEQTDDDILAGFYHTEATFGINPVIQGSQIRDVIISELAVLDWYIENDYPEYAYAILDFTVGYILFNFAVPPLAKSLFILYYRMREPQFFSAIGYLPKIHNGDRIDIGKVKKEIKRIQKIHKKQFPFAKPLVGNMSDSEGELALLKSYLEMLSEINFVMK